MNDNQSQFLRDFIRLMERYNISNCYVTDEQEIAFSSNNSTFVIRSYSRYAGVEFVDRFKPGSDSDE